ncbi:MAG TPA: sterol desaturase family protein [Stellaceae bacterium]|jgi:sterol desaturase/sphingolipid hydroxylase (fatty acid hydroxylase superfamily)
MSAILLILKWSTPAVAVFATIEGLILWRARRRYDWRAYLASMTDMLMRDYVVYAYLGFSLAAPLIGWVWAHRLTTVPLANWSAIVALFIGQDFCYYWFHRASHRVRFFWLSHAVHHSSNEMNLAAAFRIGWTSRLIGTSVFFVPMMWLGFRPGPVFITLNLALLYQFWLHNSWAPKLGPLELVLNTPSHHRVHHAANPEYIDKNYGGVLIVFDRLFGTFAEERDDAPCRYGLVTPLRSDNPIRIAFHEYLALARDLGRKRSVGAWAQALFGPPREHPAVPAPMLFPAE